MVVTMCHHHRGVSGGCSGGVLREECAGGVHGSGLDSPPDVGEASGDGFGCG